MRLRIELHVPAIPTNSAFARPSAQLRRGQCAPERNYWQSLLNTIQAALLLAPDLLRWFRLVAQRRKRSELRSLTNHATPENCRDVDVSAPDAETDLKTMAHTGS